MHTRTQTEAARGHVLSITVNRSDNYAIFMSCTPESMLCSLTCICPITNSKAIANTQKPHTHTHRQTPLHATRDKVNGAPKQLPYPELRQLLHRYDTPPLLCPHQTEAQLKVFCMKYASVAASAWGTYVGVVTIKQIKQIPEIAQNRWWWWWWWGKKKRNKLDLRKSFQAHQRRQPDAVVWPALTLYTTSKSTTQFDVYQINTHRFLDFLLSGAQMQMQSDSQRVVRQNCDGDCDGNCDGKCDGNAASVRRQLLLLPTLWSYHSATCHTMLRRKHDDEDTKCHTMWMKQLAKQNAEKVLW